MSFLIRLFILTIITNYAFAQKVDSVGFALWVSTAKADSMRIIMGDDTVIAEGRKLIYHSEKARMAAYPGDYAALNADLKSEFKYPEQTDKNLSGKIKISFIVDRDGTLYSFVILDYFDQLIAEEVIRTLKNIKKWIPGKQSGYIVRQPMKLSFWIPKKE